MTRIAVLLDESGQPALRNGLPIAVEMDTHRRTAHVTGNQVDIFHCPFCGSGAVVARSDMSIECSFCNAAFTVTVSPMYPAFPMSMNGGEPYPWPGRPDGGMDPAMMGDPSAAGGDGFGGGLVPGGGAGPDGGDEGDPAAGDDGDDGGSEGGPPQGGQDEDTEAEVGGSKRPPFTKKQSSADPMFYWRQNNLRYRTASGAYLNDDDYLRHLALATAENPNALAAQIRQERRG